MLKDVNLSRRAMLAGATAAIPATAIASPSIGQDAELLALGAQLDQVEQEWLIMRVRCDKDQAAFNVRLEEDTGIAWHNAPDIDEDPTGYWNTRSALSKASHDNEELGRTIDHIHGRLYPLAERILSMKAGTAAGLAVQARAVTLAAAELWDEDRHDHTHEQLFIEAVCAFLGITPPPQVAARARSAS